jgi:hypothetical protein
MKKVDVEQTDTSGSHIRKYETNAALYSYWAEEV